MTLIDHLKELRNRIIVCAIALVICTIFCFVFWLHIVGWLLAPARETHPGFQLSVFSPTETFGVLFKVGLYGGIILASPVWLYEIIAFIVPGLTPSERKIVLPGVLGTVLFLAGGMAFAYWVILPASLGFLLDFGGAQFDPVIGAKQYMDFATKIIFWVGISFELPMVLALAARLGLVRARQLISFWRYAIVLVFIIAAVVTPTPDPLTQTLVAGPLLGLYVIGVVFALVLQRPPRAAGVSSG
jgi:sec-independent protein translocase protein TatC